MVDGLFKLTTSSDSSSGGTILSLVHPVRKLAHDTNKASVSIIKNLLFIISFPFFFIFACKDTVF